MQIVQSRWSNRGINLWEVSLFTQPMPQGQLSYSVPAQVIDVIPQSVFLRQYAMAPATSLPGLTFTTAVGSKAVTIAGLTAAPPVGGYISIVVPIAVGGVVLLGFLAVVSTPSATSVIVNASIAATSAVTAGAGIVPAFTSTAESATISVALPNHGLLAGQNFTVQQPTTVGGTTLQGDYPVVAVTDANDFTITAGYPAYSAQTVSENGGEPFVATQNGAVDPVDILLYTMSRDEYAAIPDKEEQGRPTAFWFDRTAPTGSLNIWEVPDGFGPYELRYYGFTYMQDAIPSGLTTLDAPFRFLAAYVDEVAVDMALKWAPARLKDLRLQAQVSWKEASTEDREKVTLHAAPDFSSYFGRS